MLTKSQLGYLKDRIFQEVLEKGFCYMSTSGMAFTKDWKEGSVFRQKLDDNVIAAREEKTNKLNSLLDLLNPNVALGQISLGRGLAIYNECARL